MTAAPPDAPPGPPPTARRTGLVLLLTGVIGWLASFGLTLAGLARRDDPDSGPACAVNAVITCGGALSSWQGEVFGFPNMLLGLGAFAAAAALGAAVLGGARLHPVLWYGLAAGSLAGVVFVHWFVYQSLAGLGTLCPYCMVVWTVTIALFWYVALHVTEHGIVPLPPRARPALRWLLDTHGLVLAAWYALIALAALLRFAG
ncbi:vitamin K epoxide reductase family protein [Streptomyces sp. YIM 98790]|uniref:vitamin K epoxide reductase family protein n=1 Tax=Streptomyces sp. YIM 98790 TaxID=2689077 RepID=UPI0028BE7258|nr:vitamin K epoxide reductase family protein [Streptomyces sp. YIM 98790]